jgi:hypothetical protein
LRGIRLPCDTIGRREMASVTNITMLFLDSVMANTRILRITYIGGPTALLEWGGFRFLTDSTFDPIGSEFHAPSYTLRYQRGAPLHGGCADPRCWPLAPDVYSRRSCRSARAFPHASIVPCSPTPGIAMEIPPGAA